MECPEKPITTCEACGLQDIGENQHDHMGVNDCAWYDQSDDEVFSSIRSKRANIHELMDKIEEYSKAARRSHSADKKLKKAEDAEDADLRDFTVLVESSDEWAQYAADIKREIFELMSVMLK